jgi:diguanylate cyclase
MGPTSRIRYKSLVISLYRPPKCEIVSEASDWKQKYRDSLVEMEAEETRWRKIEQVLRRLIGRLCAAGMGVNPQLDDELIALAAANRRNADAEELAKLAESLTTTVVAVDAVAPIPTITFATTDTQTRVAIRALLERLPASESAGASAPALIAELANAKNDQGLAAILMRAADVIYEHSERLARERLQTAALLSQVTKRLEEMGSYLMESSTANRLGFDDSQSHNASVMAEMHGLTDEVGSATELVMLQSLVSQRLERVARQVSDFRAREDDRMLEFSGRAERMRARIADLERETSDLHSKLANEKQGARLDPLTGVANRKSLDERFIQEMARGPRADHPLAMLLWDIDSFKFVNDSYGHRAGDRVLQSVASCFMAALRSGDFVARIGGEEFVVLLSGVRIGEAMRIGNQVRSAVEALRFHFRGTPVLVTVSCGITELQEGDAPESAFDRADAALYRAKKAGKNLCVAA